jgi:hypothetical protein
LHETPAPAEKSPEESDAKEEAVNEDAIPVDREVSVEKNLPVSE